MIPYRAKTPLETIPYATIALIILSIVAFFLTSVLSPFGIASAPFQNASLWQLLGNALFLWVFGSAVENRLGIGKLLLIYLIGGYAGGASSLALASALGVEPRFIGEIGATLGCVGAFLYLFPFARINIFPSLGLLRFATADEESAGDWLGVWVGVYYLILTFAASAFTLGHGAMGGVLALGGIAGGILGGVLPLALREGRDSEEASQAQSLRSDVGGDYTILAVHELESLIERDPENPELILTYCRKAMSAAITSAEANSQTVNYTVVREMFIKKAHFLLNGDEPETIARMALALSNEQGTVPAAVLLRIGGKMESIGDYNLAEQLYQRVFLYDPRGRDGELALIRKARLVEQSHPDKSEAAKLYIDLLQRFPNGMQSTYAHDALRRMGVTPPVVTAASTRAQEATPVAPQSPDGGPAIPTSAATHGMRPIGG